MATRQSAALDRKKFLADPIMVSTIVVLITFLTLFILYPLAVLLVDSVYGKESGLVIATGGGCVTQKENYQLLHQNGKIVWIKRDIHSLATDGRPLSVENKLEEMYAIRKPMYEQFSDYVVHNDAGVHEIVKRILEKDDVQ